MKSNNSFINEDVRRLILSKIDVDGLVRVHVNKKTKILAHNLNLHRKRPKVKRNNGHLPIHTYQHKYRLIHLLDKLKTEQDISKINSHEIIIKWRNELRKQKLVHLKNDYLKQINFNELLIKNKDIIIQNLNNELVDFQDFELNSYKLLKTHFKDTLIDLYQDVLASLKTNYENELEFIRNKYEDEISSIKENQHAKIIEVNLQINSIVIFYTQDLDLLNMNHKKLKDDLNSLHKNNMLNLKIYYKNKVSSLAAEKQKCINEFNKKYKNDFKKSYVSLLNQIKKSKIEIESNNDKIEELEAKINTYQEQIDRYDSIHFKLLNIKKENYQRFKLKKNQLSNKVASTNQINYKRIQSLVVHINQVFDRLNKKLDKAEKLLNLMKKCKTLEIVHDEVVVIDNYDIYEYMHCDSRINNNLFTNADFLKKYNMTSLQINVLKNEKSVLIKENLSLKQQLKEYLLGLKSDEKLILSKFI